MSWTTPVNRFSVAEQSAMSLDGEVYSIGRAYMVIDIPLCTIVRVAVASDVTPRNSALCGRTAAWAYGAIAQLPARIDVCNIPGEKIITTKASEVRAHELVLVTEDIATYHRWHITTPARTVIDLLKASVQSCDASSLMDAIDDLVQRYSLNMNAIVSLMQRSSRMPYKRALMDLARSLSSPREHDKRHTPHRFYGPN